MVQQMGYGPPDSWISATDSLCSILISSQSNFGGVAHAVDPMDVLCDDSGTLAATTAAMSPVCRDLRDSELAPQ